MPRRRRAVTESAAFQPARTTTHESTGRCAPVRAGAVALGRRSPGGTPTTNGRTTRLAGVVRPIELSLSVTIMEGRPEERAQGKAACSDNQRGSYFGCLKRVKSWL
ncbi:hypothetical protein [Paludisphaera borealis]|uniref:hypothetical protein n=1 Tax=Paludisphaera borealis TaxID=1387353 RepID=UPI0011AB3F13|nr:hypothetical protein [Paludisphaera borealis]